MIKVKSVIKQVLRYPLMWVMLLWALTLPGHEVFVYDFILSVVSGKPVTEKAHGKQEISSSEKHNISHVFQDATPIFTGKVPAQVLYFAPGGVACLLHQPASAISSITYSLQTRTVQQLLQFSVLPNAP